MREANVRPNCPPSDCHEFSLPPGHVQSQVKPTEAACGMCRDRERGIWPGLTFARAALSLPAAYLFQLQMISLVTVIGR